MDTLFLAGVALLVSAVTLTWILPLISRSPAVGLVFLTIPLLVDLIIDLPILELAGFKVDLATDVAGLVLLAIGLLRLLNSRRSLALGIVIVFIALFGLSLGRGLLNYGLSGHLEFSGALFLIAGLAYGSSFRLTAPMRHQILRAMLWVSGMLMVVSIAVWAGLGPPDAGVPAPVALVIAQAGVLCVVAGLERTRTATPYLVVGGVLIGFAVLLQHRTVWVTLLVAVLWISMVAGRRSPRLVAVLATVAMLGLMSQSFGLGSARTNFEAGSLAQSMQTAVSDDRTFEWRQDYWRYTLETHRDRGATAVAVGAGYGAPWITSGPLVDRLEGPHNQYVEFVVRFGILGLVAWLALLGWSARSLWRSRISGTGSGLSNSALLVLLLMQATWSMAYWMDNWQPLIFGLAIAAAVEGSNPVAVRRAAREPTLALYATHRPQQESPDHGTS